MRDVKHQTFDVIICGRRLAAVSFFLKVLHIIRSRVSSVCHQRVIGIVLLHRQSGCNLTCTRMMMHPMYTYNITAPCPTCTKPVTSHALVMHAFGLNHEPSVAPSFPTRASVAVIAVAAEVRHRLPRYRHHLFLLVPVLRALRRVDLNLQAQYEHLNMRNVLSRCHGTNCKAARPRSSMRRRHPHAQAVLQAGMKRCVPHGCLRQRTDVFRLMCAI